MRRRRLEKLEGEIFAGGMIELGEALRRSAVYSADEKVGMLEFSRAYGAALRANAIPDWFVGGPSFVEILRAAEV